MHHRAVILGSIVMLLAIFCLQSAEAEVTVYDSTIEFNGAVDSNNQYVVGTARLYNITAGTGPWDFSLNSTGGVIIDGIGNATSYRIDIIWQGSKVNQTDVTTSATAGTRNIIDPAPKCRVYKIDIQSVKDFFSKTLTTSFINITAPNATETKYSSATGFTQTQAQNGTWTVEIAFKLAGQDFIVNTTDISLTANLITDFRCYELAVDIDGTVYDIWADNLVPTDFSWDPSYSWLRTEGGASSGTYVKLYAYVGDKTAREVRTYAGSLISWEQEDSLVEVVVKAVSPIDVVIDLSLPAVVPPVEEEVVVLTVAEQIQTVTGLTPAQLSLLVVLMIGAVIIYAIYRRAR